MGFYMDSKYLIAGLCGYRIGLPLQNVIGAEIIEGMEKEKFSDNIGTINFRGKQIAFINLKKRINGGKERCNVVIALEHPFCTLGISVDLLEGIFECREILPLPEIIKRATKGLLQNFGFIKERIFFTLKIDALLSLEEFRMLESGVAV